MKQTRHTDRSSSARILKRINKTQILQYNQFPRPHPWLHRHFTAFLHRERTNTTRTKNNPPSNIEATNNFFNFSFPNNSECFSEAGAKKTSKEKAQARREHIKKRNKKENVTLQKELGADEDDDEEPSASTIWVPRVGTVHMCRVRFQFSPRRPCIDKHFPQFQRRSHLHAEGVPSILTLIRQTKTQLKTNPRLQRNPRSIQNTALVS